MTLICRLRNAEQEEGEKSTRNIFATFAEESSFSSVRGYNSKLHKCHLIVFIHSLFAERRPSFPDAL